MKIVEDAQLQITHQVDAKQEIVNQTIQEFIKDSDTMLTKLADCVVEERQKMLPAVSTEPASDVNRSENESDSIALSSTSTLHATTTTVSEIPGTGAQSPICLSPDLLGALRSEWTSFFESQLPPHLTGLKNFLLDEMDKKITHVTEGSSFTTNERDLLEQQRIAVQSLQTWTVSHTQECRQCYDYLNWAFEDVKAEQVVFRCLTATIDQVANMAALEEFQLLKKNTSWTMEQLTRMQQQQQFAVVSVSQSATARSSLFSRHTEIAVANSDNDGSGGCEASSELNILSAWNNSNEAAVAELAVDPTFNEIPEHSNNDDFGGVELSGDPGTPSVPDDSSENSGGVEPSNLLDTVTAHTTHNGTNNDSAVEDGGSDDGVTAAQAEVADGENAGDQKEVEGVDEANLWP